MPYRKVPLVQGKVYHIYNRSIAGFKIFRFDNNYQRMMDTISYYNTESPLCKFSDKPNTPKPGLGVGSKLVRIVAYCLMPTHFHLILQHLKEGSISQFINLVLKSYSKFFNVKHNRKGPLWEGPFKNVLVETDEQLFHLTRYIHLNPPTDFLVDNPRDWKFSSYGEYLGFVDNGKRLCDFADLLNIEPVDYEQFVLDRVGYQRELSLIKHLIF